MEQVNISQLKNSLSAILERVKSGICVVIYDRNMPVATLTGLSDKGEGEVKGMDEEFLLALMRKGVIVRGSERGVHKNVILEPPPVPKTGADILKALELDRQE